MWPGFTFFSDFTNLQPKPAQLEMSSVSDLKWEVLIPENHPKISPDDLALSPPKRMGLPRLLLFLFSANGSWAHAPSNEEMSSPGAFVLLEMCLC